MTFDDVSIASADEHLRVTDALVRFGAGIDRADERLLASALATDAVVDFGPCGTKLGLDVPVMKRRGDIVTFLAATGLTQATSHVVANARVRVEGSAAKLLALVDATHVSKSDPSRRFQMVNWYELDLVAADVGWLAARLVIDNIWSRGQPNLLSERA